MTTCFNVLSAGLMLVLAGCNASKGLDLQTTGSVAQAKNKIESNLKKVKAPEREAAISVHKERLKATNFYGQNSAKIEAPSAPGFSARCRQIVASTGIETTILRSPTVTAQVNDEGNMSAGMSFDAVDLRRANLKEDLAWARCRRHIASTRLAQLLVTSPLALTRAGYLAKANTLQSSGIDFKKIERSIAHSLNIGDLTAPRASGLRQHLNSVRGGEARARGEAVRREVVDGVQVRDAAGLDQELVLADRQIQFLQNRLRTADAIKVNFSGGYTYDSQSTSGQTVVEKEGDTYGKVKVSFRLGAFRKRRFALEDQAATARSDTFYENNTGVFWRTREFARANRRALSSLEKQQKLLTVAYGQARRNAERRSTLYHTELLGGKLRSKIDMLSLKADLRGLEATIRDTRRIEKKLSFR